MQNKKISELLHQYFELGVAEGREGRNHDTEAGDAQRVLSEIEAEIAALADADPVSFIVPDHCSGTALIFEGGCLHVRKDGSGHIVVDEDDFKLEDDRCEGEHGSEGSVHWIARFPAGEMTALRNFLNGQDFPAPPAPSSARPQCCMCGKKGLSTVEGDGGTECELSDGRWVCSSECYDRAVEPAPSVAVKALDFDAVYVIPREMTDDEWADVKYNVDRKANPDIELWRIKEAVKYANFIAGHRGRSALSAQVQDVAESKPLDLNITKEWFEKRAALESDHEIGAGRRKLTVSMDPTPEELAELYRIAHRIPEGWQLVPKEPTHEMLKAMFEAMFEAHFDGTSAPMIGAGYDAALAAAPSKQEG